MQSYGWMCHNMIWPTNSSVICTCVETPPGRAQRCWWEGQTASACTSPVLFEFPSTTQWDKHENIKLTASLWCDEAKISYKSHVRLEKQTFFLSFSCRIGIALWSLKNNSHALKKRNYRVFFVVVFAWCAISTTCVPVAGDLTPQGEEENTQTHQT